MGSKPLVFFLDGRKAAGSNPDASRHYAASFKPATMHTCPFTLICG